MVFDGGDDDGIETEGLFFSESAQHSYEREDERWSHAAQWRDWLILIGIGLLHFTWMFMVFLFERGIR